MGKLPRGEGGGKSPFSIIPTDVEFYGILTVLAYQWDMIALIAANGQYDLYMKFFNEMDWGDVYHFYCKVLISRVG